MVDAKLVQTKDALRLAVLHRLYDSVNGDPGLYLMYDDLQTEWGVPEEEIHTAFRYLAGRGLVNLLANAVAITHEGVDEVESAVRNPRSATANFDQGAVSQSFHFYGSVGAVQSGTGNTANVVQNNGSNPAEVVRLLGEIRQTVKQSGSEMTDAALELIDSAERAALSTPPNPQKALKLLGHIGQWVAAASPYVEVIAKLLGTG